MTADDRSTTVASGEISQALNLLLGAGRLMEVTLGTELGLRPTDVRALSFVTQFERGVGPAELSHLLGITTASATALADRLEAVGHLRRAPHPSDRRRVDLVPTDSARASVRAALAPVQSAIAAITDGLSPDEAAVVVRFLSDVTAVIKAFNEKA